MPELRTARENARLEIGSQRGRNSHQTGLLGIYDLQGLSYGRTELLVAGMRLLAPDRRRHVGGCSDLLPGHPAVRIGAQTPRPTEVCGNRKLVA